MSLTTDPSVMRVKVLEPIRQGNGSVRYRGEIIALPKDLAEEFLRKGCVEKCAPMADDSK